MTKLVDEVRKNAYAIEMKDLTEHIIEYALNKGQLQYNSPNL